jgi:hypothetical protein
MWCARRHRAAAILAAVTTCATIVALAAPGEARAAGPTLFGLHQDLTYDGHAWRRAQGIEAARSAGSQVSRNSFVWSHVEPVEGQRDWSRYDAVVDELTGAGMEIVFAVQGSPSWANGAGNVPDAKFYVPEGTGEDFHRWVTRYEGFVRESVRRYRGRVHRWELWNEENEDYFWKPRPSVEQYAVWYSAMRRAILEEDPSAQVAVGGLAGLNAGCCIAGKDFLRRLHELGAQVDRVAVHPYPSESRSPEAQDRFKDNFTDVAMIHDYLERSGRPAPIWITEWGWESSVVGEEAQARYVRTSLEMIRDRYPFVELATYFVDHDRSPEYTHGLFRDDFSPKPAAHEFADFVASPAPSPSPPTGGVAPPIIRAVQPVVRRGRVSVRMRVSRCRPCAGRLHFRRGSRWRSVAMRGNGRKLVGRVRSARERLVYYLSLRDRTSGLTSRSERLVVALRR